jgi:hypothetical protein
MGVIWNKIYETSDTGYMPTTSANSWSVGINAPSGKVEFLQLRYNLTFDTVTPVATSEISALINSIRVVQNGEVLHDFSAGYSSEAVAGESQYGYLINKIGGRVVEVPSSTDAKVREGYIMIPLGSVTTGSVTRYQATSTISSGSLSWWLRFNDNVQTQTTVVPATSFVHTAGAYELVTVRVPQNVKGVVSGLLVLNDSEEDQYGTQGIRINALSQFGQSINQIRAHNGDLDNGIMYNAGSTSDLQTYATSVKGSIFIPTFGLSGGDIQVSVDSTTATTRRYLPIITNNVGSKQMAEVRQTQASVGNTAKAILMNDLQ